MWEVDPEKREYGGKVWGRNPSSHIPSAREWHWVPGSTMRKLGVPNVPTYNNNSWEIDWDKRNGKLIWGRNLNSKMPRAREWHWVDFHTVERSGIDWRPARSQTGRTLNSNGYIQLCRSGMTAEQIETADKYNLWHGGKSASGKGYIVTEHQLVAAEKFGGIPDGCVVRHMNGTKTDNHPNNLLLGTNAENTADHNSARLSTMYWHNRADSAESQLVELERRFTLHMIADHWEIDGNV